MSQRASGFGRKPDEEYRTIPWPIAAVLPYLDDNGRAWDCCDPDPGPGALVTTPRALGVDAVGTSTDFFNTKPPPSVTHLITNPPYGENRRGEMAVRFIERAFELHVPHIAMLVRADFDFAITRQHLFRNNLIFAGKVTLLGRVKWFPGPGSPSDNHCWMLFDREHDGPSVIHYITSAEAKHALKLAGVAP